MESKQSDQIGPLNKIKSLLRKKSVMALLAVSQKNDLQVEEIPAEDKILGHWMSVISVSGEQIHLTFKVQFSVDMARSYAQEALKKAGEGISNSHCKDFIREYSNMVAGYVKNALMFNSIQVGVSLPLLCRGFDDFFFDSTLRAENSTDRWKLVHNGAVIYCSAVIELNDDFKLKALEEDLPLTGEVEFL